MSFDCNVGKIRRIMLTLLMALLVVCSMPAGVFAGELPSLDEASIYHTPANDYRPGDCVLTSVKNTIRRAAISKGSLVWSSITNKDLRKKATVGGNTSCVWNNFKYNNDGIEYTIKCGSLTGKNANAKIATLAGLLKKYPYGVVVWGRNAYSGGAHAVLAVKVKNNTVYAVDSTNNRGLSGYGIQKWKKTTMKSISRCTNYWVITKMSGSSTSAKKGSVASKMSISGLVAPSRIKMGKSFGISGDICSNYKILKVTVSVIDEEGNKVITKTDTPNSWYYLINDIDPYIKFGTLDPGNYTFKITARDTKKSKTLCNESFSVYKTASSTESTLRITGVRAPESLVEGHKFTILGIVKSNYNISSVKINVVDSEGKVRLSASASPGAKKYDIKKLDSKIKFATLKAGTYRYKVKAKDSKKSKTLVNREFEVTES